MAKGEDAGGLCIRQCGATAVSVLAQLVCAAVFLVTCFFVVGWGLELTRVVGVTTVPPGLKYAPFLHDDGRFYR
jgi:hypothetical protein